MTLESQVCVSIAFVTMFASMIADRQCHCVQRIDIIHVLNKDVTICAVLPISTPYRTSHGYDNQHLRACN